MSIYNLAGTTSSELGSLLTGMLKVENGNYDNLTLLVTICSLSGALPLPFINLLDEGQHGVEVTGLQTKEE